MTTIFHANGELLAQRHEEPIGEVARHPRTRTRCAERGPGSESAAQVRTASQTWHAAGDDLAAQVDKMLEDLVVAESWESMALRSVTARSRRDLVAVPVAAPRRGR